MDLELKVNKDVLIPRPETEELVQWVLDDVKSQLNMDAERSRSVISTSIDNHSLQILDIGTGSGCIAIALAKYLPGSKVYAMDISEKALEVAKENAENNQVEVEFIHQSILDPELELNFDIIVSNPPYVRELEKDKMKKNVTDYEPHTALFVPDDDALVFYGAIAEFAKKYLRQGGSLYLEINQYLGEETKSLLKTLDFSEIELRNDMFGNPRMLKGTNR
jgi:release factor glutamine methyltransferase